MLRRVRTMLDAEFYRLPDGTAPVEDLFRVGSRIILTSGFVKKTQKTPEGEKKLAQKYKADYERRHSHE